MKNFSSIEYVNIWDMFKLVNQYGYILNLIYKNNYIELKFEDVYALVKTGVNEYSKAAYTYIVIDDKTPSKNMTFCMDVKYNYFYLDKEKSNKDKLYLIYNENICFEVIKNRNYKTNVYINPKKYEEVTEMKNENELLKNITNLKIVVNESNDSYIFKKIFRKEKNLIKNETFTFEEGKRKIFYDPRYSFKVEGCYNKHRIDYTTYNEEIEFEGRKNMNIKLNSQIFTNEPSGLISYKVIKENIDPYLWSGSYYNREEAEKRYEEQVRLQKSIEGITKVEDLYIVEFEQDTENIEKILFNKKTKEDKKQINNEYQKYEYYEDEYNDYDQEVVGFEPVEDDDIPF